jgi:hypothetical protein
MKSSDPIGVEQYNFINKQYRNAVLLKVLYRMRISFPNIISEMRISFPKKIILIKCMLLFVCVGVVYSGEYDVCGVTLSAHPHQQAEKFV